MNNLDHISESSENVFGLKYLNSLMRIWDHRFRKEKIRIWEPGWKKIRILDKHPGSATLNVGLKIICFALYWAAFRKVVVASIAKMWKCVIPYSVVFRILINYSGSGYRSSILDEYRSGSGSTDLTEFGSDWIQIRLNPELAKNYEKPPVFWRNM
jgi:hypothetical protein